jgi:murein DD-endopeptidase MepM/ murein hydrolase activator NlpD
LRSSPRRKFQPFTALYVCSILWAFALPCVSTTHAQDNPHGGPGSGPTIHIVQPGETLVDVAHQYNTTVEELAAANGLDVGTDLVVGQRLVISNGGQVPGASMIIIGAADTLEVLAARSGSTVEQVAALNGIVNPAQIYAGQPLTFPANNRGQSAGKNELVRVAAETTLWHIALRRNVPIRMLLALNQLDYPYIYAPGELLTVPAIDAPVNSLLRSPWKNIDISPLPLEVGRSAVVHVATIAPATITGTFMGKDLIFAEDQSGFTTILGVYRWTTPGLYPFTITATQTDGSSQSFTRQVMISPGGYASEIIRLSADDAEVYADTVSVQEEASYIASLMSGFTEERLWEGLFQLPAPGIMSSGFGTARSYDNGATYDVFHAGADFAAERGTPITAPANGMVVATGELEIRGYFTVIDHGWGIYSGFWHQSSIQVTAGDRVTVGQQIGAIGNTGLSTAAHVHWEMWVEGVQVDPLQWVRQSFP